jgi:hypothetical protein
VRLSPKWKKRLKGPASGPGKTLRKVLVALLGGGVLLFGIALIFLPGPSVLVIPLGLGILALEFTWARELLKKFRSVVKGGRKWISKWRKKARRS